MSWSVPSNCQSRKDLGSSKEWDGRMKMPMYMFCMESHICWISGDCLNMYSTFWFLFKLMEIKKGRLTWCRSGSSRSLGRTCWTCEEERHDREGVSFATGRRFGSDQSEWGRNCPGAAVASRVHCTPTRCTAHQPRAQKVNAKETLKEVLHTSNVKLYKSTKKGTPRKHWNNYCTPTMCTLQGHTNVHCEETFTALPTKEQTQNTSETQMLRP